MLSIADLSKSALRAIGVAKLGNNVKISDKTMICGGDQMRVGDNGRIDDLCGVTNKLTIGRNVYSWPCGLIVGGTPGLEFEDFTTLAYRV